MGIAGDNMRSRLSLYRVPELLQLKVVGSLFWKSSVCVLKILGRIGVCCWVELAVTCSGCIFNVSLEEMYSVIRIAQITMNFL